MLTQSWTGPVSADATANVDGGSTTPTTVAARRQAAKRKWLFSTILVPVVFAVLALSVLGFGLFLQNHTVEKPEPKPNPDPTIGKSNSEKEKHPSNSANIAKVELAVQRAQFQIELAAAVQLQREVRFAETELDDLLKSTESDYVGKRIAGNKELLLRFRAFKQSLKNPPSISATSLSAIENAAQNARDNHKQLEASLNEATKTPCSVDAFFTTSISAASTKCGNPLLPFLNRSTLLTLRFNSMNRRSRCMRKQVANDAARELKNTLDGERESAIGQQSEAVKLVDELETQLEQIRSGKPFTSETTDAVLPPQASRDDYERELEKIRTHLIAFTTPGYVQPESADKLVFRSVKQPMSYSALRRIGALDATNEGRATLLCVGGSKSATQRNDRPLGSFPRMNSIEQLRDDKNLKARVDEAQQLLRRYGPLMVEDGLLLP